MLSRWNHLHNHLKRIHKSDENRRNVQPHYFLKAQQRPCGFCGCTYVHWRQWLSHIAAHFEGKLPRGVRRMSEWKETLHPFAEVQEPSDSEIHLAVEQDEFKFELEFGSFTNGADCGSFFPSNNPESFGDNADGYNMYCSQATHMYKGAIIVLFTTDLDARTNLIPKGLATTIREDITTINYSCRDHRDEKPPPSTVADMRNGSSHKSFLGNITEEEEEGAPMPPMPILGIGIQSEANSESSISSCGCISCVRSLQTTNPGVQMLPGTLPGNLESRGHLNRYRMDRYLKQKNDPWTVWRPPKAAKCEGF